MKRIVIAIDGPAGAGKSTVSRRLADALGYRYIDTGAMYRVIGVLAAERGVAFSDTAALAALCDATQIEFVERDGALQVLAAGRDLSAAIRTAEAGQLASKVSTVPEVRTRLVAQQRRMAAGGGVVMEGRDIGTVVCPDAPVKVYLEAAAAERAQRRAAELRARGASVDLEQMTNEILERDARDSARAHSPMRPAPDAVVVDTTGKDIDAVVNELRALVRSRTEALARY